MAWGMTLLQIALAYTASVSVLTYTADRWPDHFDAPLLRRMASIQGMFATGLLLLSQFVP